MRVILYTGKGGVGKTSIAAATAIRCAQMGHRTVVLSTDAAHSLSDSLDIPIRGELKKLEDNLYAQEIDVNTEIRVSWGKIQRFVVNFLKKQGFNKVLAEEFSLLPGMDELFSLLKLKEYCDDGFFDTAILDCAPTGSTIRMLGFPDIIGWYMERFFNIERKIVKAIRPVAEFIAKVPLPTDDVYSSIEELYTKIDGIKNILTDPHTSSIRIVCNAEKMVLRESQRVFTYLNLFGFTVDAIVMNRLLPDTVNDSYFGVWKHIQEKNLREAEEMFKPLRIFTAKLFNQEMVGKELLLELARTIFSNEDPSRVFYDEKPFEATQTDGDYAIIIKLPNVEKKDIDLWVKGDELIIQIGPYRRNIIVPRSFVSLKLKKAKFEGDKLKILFGGDADG